MRPKRWVRAWGIAGIGVTTVAVFLVLAGAATGQSGRSGDDAGIGRVNSQLEEVLETQQEILKRFDEVMEELRILKIRVMRKN